MTDLNTRITADFSDLHSAIDQLFHENRAKDHEVRQLKTQLIKASNHINALQEYVLSLDKKEDSTESCIHIDFELLFNIVKRKHLEVISELKNIFEDCSETCLTPQCRIASEVIEKHNLEALLDQ